MITSMHHKFKFLILFALLTLSCSEGIEKSNLRINHYKQSAVGLGPTLVLLIQEGDQIGSDEWQYFYSGIEGFDYEWGYTYDLKVRKENIENPPEDASSIRYVLEDLIQKSRVSQEETFELRLKSQDFGIPSMVTRDETSGYLFFDVKSLECQTFCEEMEEALETNEEVTATFVHSNSGGLTLLSLDLD